MKINKRSILKKAMSKAMNKKYCDTTRFDCLDSDERLMIYKAMEDYHKAKLLILNKTYNKHETI